MALLLTGFAVQIQTVAVGWQVYDMTRNPLDLGLVGLSQFLPALVLVLVTGHGRRPLSAPDDHGAVPGRQGAVRGGAAA